MLNKYISEKLGVSSDYKFVDVLGLDEELLQFVPQPVKSVILLFPCSEKYEAHRKEQNDELEKNPPEIPKNLFYMKQTIHNACGTIAIVHSVLNNSQIALKEDGILKMYFDKARDVGPAERGRILEEDKAFAESHEQFATDAENQTSANPAEPVNHHFIALVEHEGDLWELDGRKNFPIKHGKTSEASLLSDAAKVCKEFMAQFFEAHELKFNVLALVRHED